MTRRSLAGPAFIAPFGVVFVGVLVIPLVYAFVLSLQTKTLAAGTEFTWFQNYGRAFTDPDFLSGLVFVVAFAVVAIPVQVALALAIALALDSLETRFSRFARLLIFTPYAIPVVVGALMWSFLYSKDFGPLTWVFQLVGLPAPAFLSSSLVFGSLVNVVVWQWTGYNMIVLYSALRGVDPAVYEAARIDGANGMQLALRIKIPLIAPAVVLMLIFSLIGTFQLFTEPQVLSTASSGTINGSFTPNIYAFTVAFSYADFNYAAALSFCLGAVVFAGSLIFLAVTRRRSGLEA